MAAIRGWSMALLCDVASPCGKLWPLLSMMRTAARCYGNLWKRKSFAALRERVASCQKVHAHVPVRVPVPGGHSTLYASGSTHNSTDFQFKNRMTSCSFCKVPFLVPSVHGVSGL